MNWSKPAGYVLKSRSGAEVIRINERQIPDGTQVIELRGATYVNTEDRDAHDFAVFEEGFLTHVYEPHGE
jgi:hypothetical protein